MHLPHEEPGQGGQGQPPAPRGEPESSAPADAPRPSRQAPSEGRSPQTRAQLKKLVLLGAPSLGLSFAITTISAYVPLLLRNLVRSESLIGLVVSGEGFFALTIPVVLGALSDRVRTPDGPRLPFLLSATPVAAAALVLLPWAPSLLVLVSAVGVFYLAYFAYYSPYRAMFADLVEPGLSGRAQSSQMIFREIGLGASLMGGGLLMQLWQPLPFLLAAASLCIITGVVYFGVRAQYRRRAARPPRSAAADAEHGRPASSAIARLFGTIVRLVTEHADIRRLLLANALWEFALGGLKTFVLLFIVVGLGRSVATASLLMGLVAATAVVAAPIAGTLADRYGVARIMKGALVVYGVGLFIPFFSRSFAVLLPILPVIGLGGGLAMSLPYGLLMRLMPKQEHGAAAGLFEFSRGLGTTLGPLATGAVIDWAQKPLASTHGYAAMWPVVGLAILGSIPLTPDDRR